MPNFIGVGDGKGTEGHVPPIFGENIFSGNYYIKFGHFRAKIM